LSDFFVVLAVCFHQQAESGAIWIVGDNTNDG